MTEGSHRDIRSPFRVKSCGKIKRAGVDVASGKSEEAGRLEEKTGEGESGSGGDGRGGAAQAVSAGG